MFWTSEIYLKFNGLNFRRHSAFEMECHSINPCCAISLTQSGLEPVNGIAQLTGSADQPAHRGLKLGHAISGGDSPELRPFLAAESDELKCRGTQR